MPPVTFSPFIILSFTGFQIFEFGGASNAGPYFHVGRIDHSLIDRPGGAFVIAPESLPAGAASGNCNFPHRGCSHRDPQWAEASAPVPEKSPVRSLPQVPLCEVANSSGSPFRVLNITRPAGLRPWRGAGYRIRRTCFALELPRLTASTAWCYNLRVTEPTRRRILALALGSHAAAIAEAQEHAHQAAKPGTQISCSPFLQRKRRRWARSQL